MPGIPTRRAIRAGSGHRRPVSFRIYGIAPSNSSRRPHTIRTACPIPRIATGVRAPGPHPPGAVAERTAHRLVTAGRCRAQLFGPPGPGGHPRWRRGRTARRVHGPRRGGRVPARRPPGQHLPGRRLRPSEVGRGRPPSSHARPHEALAPHTGARAGWTAVVTRATGHAGRGGSDLHASGGHRRRAGRATRGSDTSRPAVGRVSRGTGRAPEANRRHSRSSPSGRPGTRTSAGRLRRSGPPRCSSCCARPPDRAPEARRGDRRSGY